MNQKASHGMLDENKETARRFFEKGLTGNLKVLGETTALAYVSHGLGGSTIEGRDALIEYVVAAQLLTTDLSLIVVQMVAEDCRVATQYTASGNFLGSIPIAYMGLVISRFEERESARIVEDWVLPDVVTIVRQILKGSEGITAGEDEPRPADLLEASQDPESLNDWVQSNFRF